ncbi:MAG: alcohol dehydrogenase catalytic domain-containing protein, partial [Myxococcota bacterium]
MKALCFDDDLTLRDVDPPAPGPNEATIRVRMAGICNTDVEIARGYMGHRGVLGHEFVGRVEAAPDPAWVGKRVCGEINLACGACDACRRGLGRHCPTRRVLGILGKDGCFAEQLTLPLANLHEVPDVLSDELAVFAEPLAAAHEVLQQIAVDPDARVLVLGDGKLGLLLTAVLLQTGAEVTLVGKHDDKLALAQRRGAQTCTPDSLDGTGFDVVVEATGSPRGLALALDRIRPRGTLVLKSTFHGAPEVDTARIVIDEIRIVGSRCGPFPPA